MPLSTTARQTPAGIHLEDGFSTKFTFASDPDVSLWEKTGQPPGVDGGDAIDQTTMHNTAWRTKAARSLKELTDAQFTAAYDPAVYDQILSLINVEQSITAKFPNGDTLDFYGYLKSFIPAELQEGTQPEATCTIICTNADPTTGAETAPNYKTAAGTDTIP